MIKIVRRNRLNSCVIMGICVLVVGFICVVKFKLVVFVIWLLVMDVVENRIVRIKFVVRLISSLVIVSLIVFSCDRFLILGMGICFISGSIRIIVVMICICSGINCLLNLGFVRINVLILSDRKKYCVS